MRQLIVVVVFLNLFVGFPAFSVIPKKMVSQPPEKKLLQKDIDAALMALQLPATNRKAALKSQGQASLKALQQIVLSNKQPLSHRWRAMTALGLVYPQQSRRFLVDMSKNSKWYLRNASLLALEQASPKVAIVTSESLLKDPSLVVRTAAVQLLARLNSKGSSEKLWKMLEDQQNFRNGQSLWVRQHIMKTLAQFSHQQDVSRFAKHLKDGDAIVQLWAIHGLEKVTGSKKESKGLTFHQRKSKWVAWAESKKLI